MPKNPTQCGHSEKEAKYEGNMKGEVAYSCPLKSPPEKMEMNSAMRNGRK